MARRAGQGQTFADKLNHLFVNSTLRNGQEYSNEHVAAAMGSAGVGISQSYIWQLRKGKKDNPTFKHVQGLADFFGVPASYFFDNDVTDRVNQQLEALKAEQVRLTTITDNSEAQLMAMRAGQLSPQRRRLVMDLLDVVYRDEQAERGESGAATKDR